jgi:hypothetical protein
MILPGSFICFSKRLNPNVRHPMVQRNINHLYCVDQKHVRNWTYLMVSYKCFSLCTKMSKANLQIDLYIKMLRQNLALAALRGVLHFITYAVFVYMGQVPVYCFTQTSSQMTADVAATPIPNGQFQNNKCSTSEGGFW